MSTPDRQSRPADPAGRPARPSRRARRRRPRPDGPRARASASCWAPASAASPTHLEDAGRRSPSRSCPAGRWPRRPATPAVCCWAASPACRSSRSRAASTCTRASIPGLVVQPVLLFHQLGAKVVVLTNAVGRRQSALRAGHAHGHHRPHQPDGPLAAHRPQRRRARAALHRPDRRLGPAPPGAPARRRRMSRAWRSTTASTSA